MEVRIAVQDAPRELVLESSETPEAIAAKVTAALTAGGVLTLMDEKGRRVLVPVERLAYVEIAASEPRRVGFGAI